MIEAHFAIAFNGTRAKDREATGHFAASFVAEVCVSNARGAYPRASAGEALKFARDELPPASLRVDQQPDAIAQLRRADGLVAIMLPPLGDAMRCRRGSRTHRARRSVGSGRPACHLCHLARLSALRARTVYIGERDTSDTPPRPCHLSP